MYNPLPMIGDRKPVASNEFNPPNHQGLDIMYRALPLDPEWPGHDTLNRSKNFYMPDNTPVMACNDGKVTYADANWKTGGIVKILHQNGDVSLYCHLAKLYVKTGDMIKASQLLGIVGGSPLDTPNHLKHLHFQYYSNDTLVNPEPLLYGPKLAVLNPMPALPDDGSNWFAAIGIAILGFFAILFGKGKGKS